MSLLYVVLFESFVFLYVDGYLQVEVVFFYVLGSEGFCYWLWCQQCLGSEILYGLVFSVWGELIVGYQNVMVVEWVRKEVEQVILLIVFV